ncbi:MAG TPA: hypothetical protein VMR97_13310 [Acidimicrobiales bacterium]|nr:hypothetical protein [Acidimicrobiales bacterium]
MIYVTCDENRALEKSLSHLPPSQPVTILDVGSSQDAGSVTKGRPVRVLRCKWGPIAEEVLRDNWAVLPEGWLLRLDPDEWIERSAFGPLTNLALTSPPSVGAYRLSRVNLYRERPLRGTVWGQSDCQTRVFRKGTARYSGVVHEPPSILGRIVDAPQDYAIVHDWVSSRADMWEKHLRYVQLERMARREAGQQAGAWKCLLLSAKAFVFSFWSRRGYLDGLRGLGLSVFYGFYVFLSNHVRSFDLGKGGGPSPSSALTDSQS